MNKKQRMNQEILRHSFRLCEYFGIEESPYPLLSLAKALRRMENKVHRLAEQHCNGEIEDMPDYEDKLNKLLVKYGATKNVDTVFINQDPRGYTLKIKSKDEGNTEEFYCRDWGGYGILAPEFTGDL